MTTDTKQVPRILIDHCVIEDGRTLKPGSYESTVDWGGSPNTAPVHCYYRPKLRPEHQWLPPELQAMNGLASAARHDRIQVCTYQELTAERISGAVGTRGLKGDLWINVQFADIEPAIDRSAFGGLTLDQFASRDHQAEFYRLLLSLIGNAPVRQQVRSMLRDDHQRAALDDLETFALICKAAAPNQICDSFHFWSAIRAGCYYFVTNDQKFLRLLRENGLNPDIAYRALLPSAACEALDIPALALPVQEGETVSFMEANDYRFRLAEEESQARAVR